MTKSLGLITSLFCTALIVSAGCIGTGTSSGSRAPATTVSESSWAGTGQIFPCSIGAPADPTKVGVLEITMAEGQGEVRDIFYVRGKIRNMKAEPVASGVAGKSCDLLTGKCVTDKVGVILKPYETVDFTTVTGGGCPASGTAATCTCEAWIDILR